LGSGRVYALNLTNGTSVLTDGDENNTQQNYTDLGGTVDQDGNAIDAAGNAVLDSNGQRIRFNSNGQRIVDFYDLKHQGIPAESTLLLLPELAICIGTECNIDSLEDALLNGFETGQAYRSFWRER
jgi:hypothetical protein